jgi:hypothetical protein
MPASRGITPLAGIPDGQRRDGPPQLVIRGKDPVVAMPVLPRRRHEIGQGSCLGDTFEEIPAMLKRIDRSKPLRDRVAVCLDTRHVFAAGYSLAPQAALDETLPQFDAAIGPVRLKVIHANDSKRECGSRVDRHEAIGEGKIGRAAFELLVNHPQLAAVPLILETLKEGSDGKPHPAKQQCLTQSPPTLTSQAVFWRLHD